MCAGHLAVDYLDVACATLLDQARQGHLGGVALQTEHRFAEEHLPQLNPIQTAYQTILTIGFHGMPESQLVQLTVRVDHLLIQPGVGTGAAGRGATADRGAEGMIHPPAEGAVLPGLVSTAPAP